jgi:hypothetical protein
MTKPSTSALINPISLKPRPTYNTSEMQALSRAEKCFKCHQFGYITRDCPTLTDNYVIEESEDKKSEKKQF